MSDEGEARLFFRSTVAPMMDVIAEDVRWHCSLCGTDGVGRDSFNAHAPDHIPDEQWREIKGIRLDSVSFEERPLHPSWTVRVVPPKPVVIPIPFSEVNAHVLARLFGTWCTHIGLRWHPGCKELPRRSAIHAAYHARRS